MPTVEPVVTESAFGERMKARHFRLSGKAVFPGALLALRDGSPTLHPVSDESYLPVAERIFGIAAWGACNTFKPGMVALEGGGYVPLICGQEFRPLPGIGIIDAWIARADVLRAIKRGRVEAYGGISLTRTQWLNAIAEIEWVVRDTAHRLLDRIPAAPSATRRALAVVVDAPHPTDDELTLAIVGLFDAKANLVVAQHAANGDALPSESLSHEDVNAISRERAKLVREVIEDKKVMGEALDALKEADAKTTDVEALARIEAGIQRVEAAVESVGPRVGASVEGEPGADEPARPALKRCQSQVLQTMAQFDGSRLLSAEMIAVEMDSSARLSEETVRQSVAKLIEVNYAERPEGPRSGARLTIAGRRLAGKIAD